MGVSISLPRAGAFLERWVGVVLCVTENEGQAIVKIGKNGKRRTVDFNDEKQSGELFDEIAAFLKAIFDDPRKITKQPIGFVTEANPQEGEKQE